MIKKIKYLLPAIALFLMGCDSDDDGFYNSVYVQANELVTIENPQPAYNAGEVVRFEAHVPRLLSEPGFTQPLDLLATTNADNFEFAFFIERRDANNEWELYDISSMYVPGTEGTANVETFVQGFLDFDAAADAYLYNGGIAFTEPGTYRLNFSNRTQYTNKVYLQSNSENNNIVVSIFSGMATLDAEGTFQFTVN